MMRTGLQETGVDLRQVFRDLIAAGRGLPFGTITEDLTVEELYEEAKKLSMSINTLQWALIGTLQLIYELSPRATSQMNLRDNTGYVAFNWQTYMYWGKAIMAALACGAKVDITIPPMTYWVVGKDLKLTPEEKEALMDIVIRGQIPTGAVQNIIRTAKNTRTLTAIDRLRAVSERTEALESKAVGGSIVEASVPRTGGGSGGEPDSTE